MRLTTSTRTTLVHRPADEVWAVVAGAGPGPHWYADAAPFVFRGGLDRLVGGGPSAPVPDRPVLLEGDRAGFWLVLHADGERLSLEAQVRAPGVVRFDTLVEPDPAGARLTQRVAFRPGGLLGTAYLLADLPAREVLLALVHQRTVREVGAQPRQA